MKYKNIRLTKEELIKAFEAGERDFRGCLYIKGSVLCNFARPDWEFIVDSDKETIGCNMGEGPSEVCGVDFRGPRDFLKGRDIPGPGLFGADLTGPSPKNSTPQFDDLCGFS